MFQIIFFWKQFSAKWNCVFIKDFEVVTPIFIELYNYTFLLLKTPSELHLVSFMFIYVQLTQQIHFWLHAIIDIGFTRLMTVNFITQNNG